MSIISVIKYEGGNDTFVYKYPEEDFNAGTQLIVHESQEAIFFHDGKMMDRFGPGKHTLDTDSMPMMKGFFNKIADGPSMFHSEIYFVNLTTLMNIKWGTDSKVRMYDPASGMHIEIGAFGEFNIRVVDSGKLLLKLIGTELELKKNEIIGGMECSKDSATGKFRAMLMTKVKSYLAKAIRENNIDILEVDEHLDEISEFIKNQVNQNFETYGLTVPDFYIVNIATPDDDPNFRRLKEQYAERYLKVREENNKKAEAEAKKERLLVEASTEAEVKLIGVKAQEEATRRMAYAEAEKTRAEGLAKGDAMKAQGYTYAQETQRQVGIGLVSNEGGGTVGGINNAISGAVQTGLGIGTAISVGKTTVSAMNGVLSDVVSTAKAEPSVPIATENTWVCKCGTVNDGKFCKNCGAQKPEAVAAWTCPSCGQAGNDGNFCKNCGKRRE